MIDFLLLDSLIKRPKRIRDIMYRKIILRKLAASSLLEKPVSINRDNQVDTLANTNMTITYTKDEIFGLW